MLLSEILSHLKEKDISCEVDNLIDTEITHPSVPADGDANSILFFSHGLPDNFNFDYGACFVNDDVPEDIASLRNIIRVARPRLAMILAAQLLKPYFAQDKSSISTKAIIHPEAKIGKNVIIMDSAVVGKAIIGDYTIIYPNVVIYDGVEIGSYCEINANTTIGAEGMGSERYPGTKIIKFPHFSGVIIKDGVFIGANDIIARGVLTPTTIEAGCLIDSSTHIGHNAHIGENVEVVGATICGSAIIGKNCFIGAKSIIRDNISIANNITVGMGAVVTKSFLEPGVVLAGVPARILTK